MAKAVDIDPSYISRCLWPKGKDGAKEIGIDVRDKIALKHPHWDSEYQGHLTNKMATNEAAGEDVIISQFDAAGAMGNGLVLQDRAGIIGGWNVSREWLKLNVPYCSSISNLAIVTGFGDSMKGMFNPGDPLLIDTGIKSLDSDGVYFFRVGNEGFIKRLQRIPGDGVLVASSNKEYRDWFIKPEMDFEIFGRVIKAWEGKGF
jgi:phage repressor protein C with HTH and peptisase S24 domain